MRRAEVKMTATMVKHNVPLAFTDHLSPLLRDIFPDSEIAKVYSSAKTKTTCILNGALRPFYLGELIAEMKLGRFNLSIDGSNDTGLKKMNPMTVLVSNSRVEHKFLDMCTTFGQRAGMAEVIFNKMDSVLLKHGIPWANCICLLVDNASVNIGARNSLRTRLQHKNLKAYISGCPCHFCTTLPPKLHLHLLKSLGVRLKS